MSSMLSSLTYAAKERLKHAIFTAKRVRGNRGLRARYVLERFLEDAQKAGATDRFLEVGCGNGAHADHVRAQIVFGSVECIDFSGKHGDPGHITGNYEAHEFDRPFDAIWTSHVLEHTQNPGLFLHKLHRDLREGGVLAINVPPLKQEITVGHVTLWTPGLLLLNLVKSGFDCSDAAICQHGYNIGVVLRKRSCPIGPITSFRPDDPGSARPYLPAGLSWFQNPRTGVWYFRGNFRALNW